MTTNLPCLPDLATVTPRRQNRGESIECSRKRKTLTPDALNGTVTESGIRRKGRPPRQQKQQQKQQKQQQPKLKSKLKATGKFTLQQQQPQPMAEFTQEELEGIETETTVTVDAPSTPEKTCRSIISPPQSKCSIKQGADLNGQHWNAMTRDQERMQGVYWDRFQLRWVVSYRRQGEKNKRVSFSRARYLHSGRTPEEADEEAKRQAFAFRQSLVKKGAVRLYRTSGMKKVHWYSREESWRVEWLEDGKRKQKGFSVRGHMDSGMSSEEAKEAALWSAVSFRATLFQQTTPKTLGQSVKRSNDMTKLEWMIQELLPNAPEEPSDQKDKCVANCASSTSSLEQSCTRF